jgi:hypothetical protein
MTTTISLSQETKTEFDDARPPNADSADEFLQMLLESWRGENTVDREQTIDVEDARILADHVERTLDPQLQEINAAAKEATNAAQNAERAAEELQR